MEFGMRVVSHSILKEIDNGKNVVLSPLSLHVALNMLASASSGRTLEQLLRFLECKDITQLNAQSSRFMKLANAKSDLAYEYDSDDGPLHGDAPISFVNGLWLDRRFTLKPSFKQLAEYVFQANAQSVDFQNKAREVTDEINSWARLVSKGCIDPLVPPGVFKEDVIFVLANAVYFNGVWENQFFGPTTDEDFHLLNGENIKVPFMKREADKSGYGFGSTTLEYGSFEGFEQFMLPYEKGQYKQSYEMHIFLPDKKDGLPELVQKFHSDPKFLVENRKLESIVLEKLWLPKLKYEYKLNTLETLVELGLDLPFGADAEFTEMVEAFAKEEVYVSNAIQKCYIDINEEGTIATAITYMPGLGMGMPPKPTPKSIVVDHPFLFMIKEVDSGIVVFVGAVLNPLP